jgi:Zn finger protein HypA/HybF involved in hydrogenase expression
MGKKGIKLKCNKCGKEWNYKGKKKPSDKHYVFVSCPDCHSNVKLIKS